MYNFMAILSQLFWGVTIGALSAAFTAIGQGLAVAFGIGGLGWWGLRHHRKGRPRGDTDSTRDKKRD
ncbi:hypothetical protein [Novosphingobium sp. 9]|uniref:hypothetical protein n=1 Tax=Novosphingobium sp. 9 TaxID=2025349 RepID=UPI0021B5FB07|nr:hypothetical protein [Novosphingobium sp. 9]